MYVAATSCAVNGVPSDHVTPSLTLNVHVSPSSLCSQLSARPGAVAIPSRSQVRKVSYAMSIVLYSGVSMANIGLNVIASFT